MSKLYYRLFSVRYKSKSISTRISGNTEYLDKIDIKVHCPNGLSIIPDKTIIEQNGDVTEIYAYFK